MQTLRAVGDLTYVTKAGQTEFTAGQVLELEEGHPLIGDLLATGQFELLPGPEAAGPGKAAKP